MDLWKTWQDCEEILSKLPTKSGFPLELVAPWILWHILDKDQQKNFGMVLYYAPLELIRALDEASQGIGGHPSAVLDGAKREPVSLTWALWYRAFDNPNDYFSAVKINAVPFFVPYGGSPLDELTKEDYEAAREAFAPVLRCLLENFVTGLLSSAVFREVKRLLGGKKKFESFVKENRDNILSLDRSYEAQTAKKLNQPMPHLVRRRDSNAGLLTSDHPETLHNPRNMEFYEEQCGRFDAFGNVLVRAVSGSESPDVTVGRDILEHGVPTRRLFNDRRNNNLLSAAILVGSNRRMTFREAQKLLLRLRVKCSRNRPSGGECERDLVAGIKLLTGIDAQTTEGNGNIVERCTTIIVTALTEKENETRQRQSWSTEMVDQLMNLEQQLHACRNRFDLIALTIPGKCRDQIEDIRKRIGHSTLNSHPNRQEFRSVQEQVETREVLSHQVDHR